MVLIKAKPVSQHKFINIVFTMKQKLFKISHVVNNLIAYDKN